jgi:hypothetical protein
VNGHDNISFVHEGHEQVILSTAQDKIAWLDPFAEMRPNALNGIHGEDKITLAKWLDIEVGDGIPAVMNSSGCALNGSAWFVSGALSDRSDSTLLIRHDTESELWVNFNLPDRILARNLHTFTECNGHLYLFFDTVRKELLNDVWRYDECAASWTKPDSPATAFAPAKATCASALAACSTHSARRPRAAST